MIIDSTAFKDIPGLTGAVLTESTDGPSQLTLTYGGATTPQHQFMEEMTIMHQGKVLFHGKQTRSSYSNEGGAATWTSVSSDARWTLGKQTLGQQINLTAEDMAQAARNAMESWQALAEGSTVSAAGWTCNPDGTSVDGETQIGLDVSGLTDPPLPANHRKNSPISILEAIQRLQRNNPGTYTTFDPVTGQVKILKRQDLPESHLDTLAHHVISISGIAPNDEDRIPGVVLVIDWNVQINISEGAIISNSGGDPMAGRVVRIFPPDLSPDALGVRVFTQKVTFSVGQYTNESDQFRQEVEAHADAQLAKLIPWMQEINTPAVTGSITTLMSDWQNSESALFLQTRNLVYLGKNSRLTLIHCDDSYNQNRSFSNIVTEIVLDRHAHLEHYKMQNLNDNSGLLNQTFVSMEENSILLSNSISLNGGNIRNHNEVRMNGEHCDTQVHGLYLMDKEQKIDNYVFVEHSKPNCESNELFKGILDDGATGHFNGHVLVCEGATKTLAYQSNKNILLTDKATINTKPFLEIYNDDVKCSHGTTTGQLDEQMLFYIRSRGISERTAKTLLMYAFCDEVIQKIALEPLRIRISDMVKKRLHGELSICENCALHCSSPDYHFSIDASKI